MVSEDLPLTQEHRRQSARRQGRGILSEPTRWIFRALGFGYLPGFSDKGFLQRYYIP